MTKQATSARQRSQAGQIAFEYVMLLTWVVAALILFKAQFFERNGSEMTIMAALSQAFTEWLSDIVFILCLPS